MAWNTPPTFTANTALSAATLNTYLRDSQNASEVATAITKNSIVVSTSATTLAQRTPGDHRYTQIGITSSTSYTDLSGTSAGVGPTVSIESTGTRALVLWSAQMYNSTSGAFTSMSYEVTGASGTIAASNDKNLGIERKTANKTFVQVGQAYFDTGLTAGTNVFQSKYKVDAGTGYFQVRRLVVIPF